MKRQQAGQAGPSKSSLSKAAPEVSSLEQQPDARSDVAESSQVWPLPPSNNAAYCMRHKWMCCLATLASPSKACSIQTGQSPSCGKALCVLLIAALYACDLDCFMACAPVGLERIRPRSPDAPPVHGKMQMLSNQIGPLKLTMSNQIRPLRLTILLDTLASKCSQGPWILQVNVSGCHQAPSRLCSPTPSLEQFEFPCCQECACSQSTCNIRKTGHHQHPVARNKMLVHLFKPALWPWAHLLLSPHALLLLLFSIRRPSLSHSLYRIAGQCSSTC